jgi:hypothetical protein
LEGERQRRGVDRVNEESLEGEGRRAHQVKEESLEGERRVDQVKERRMVD